MMIDFKQADINGVLGAIPEYPDEVLEDLVDRLESLKDVRDVKRTPRDDVAEFDTGYAGFIDEVLPEVYMEIGRRASGLYDGF
jgi:hypothetical protein